MHSRLARYAYAGDAGEIARRPEAEQLLPQYQPLRVSRLRTASRTRPTAGSDTGFLSDSLAGQ